MNSKIDIWGKDLELFLINSLGVNCFTTETQLIFYKYGIQTTNVEDILHKKLGKLLYENGFEDCYCILCNFDLHDNSFDIMVDNGKLLFKAYINDGALYITDKENTKRK